MSYELKMLEIDAGDVAKYPDTIDRIVRREMFGVLVRGVFPREQMERAVARIAADQEAPLFEAHTFHGRTYGRVLRMAGAVLDEYFDAANRIGAVLDRAFGQVGYEARLREIVGALSGGRPISRPTVQGRTYAPATVRVLDPGGVVELHCGNETHAFPPLAELTRIIDPKGEISTLLPLSLPESGGDLEVFDVCFGDPLIDELDRSVGRESAHRGLRGRRSLHVQPDVGDFALFEEGLHYHRVNEVRGTRARWTMGGFLAPSRDGATLHYWS